MMHHSRMTNKRKPPRRRLTIQIDADVSAWCDGWAKRRRLKPGQIIREALTEAMRARPVPPEDTEHGVR